MKLAQVLAYSLFCYFGAISCLQKADNINAGGQQAASAVREIPTFDHFPAPCTICHEVDRPPAPHIANTDCIGCHANPDFSRPSTDFDHATYPSGCVGCHEGDRPDSPTHPQVGDCISCHSFPYFETLAL